MEASSVEALVGENDIQRLSDGLVEIYQEPLEKVAGSLSELTKKQKTLIEDLESQNLKLHNSQNCDAVINMFTDVTQCRERLITIRKQMTSLHERSSRLRVRSQNVLNKAMCQKTARLQEQEREQRLIGGHTSQQTSSNST